MNCSSKIQKLRALPKNQILDYTLKLVCLEAALKRPETFKGKHRKSSLKTHLQSNLAMMAKLEELLEENDR